MFCKECFEDISPDCMLTNRTCVFCYYKIKEWESNGRVVKKRNAIISYKNLLRIYTRHYKGDLKEIENILKKIPKGTLQRKKIKGHYYYYLAYRDGQRIKYKYAGKKKPKRTAEKIEARAKLKKRMLEIKKILFVLREAKRPSITLNRYAILERDDFTCQYCGRKAPDVALEVDHIIPVSNGGTNNPSNLKTACFECNSQKRAKGKIRRRKRNKG